MGMRETARHVFATERRRTLEARAERVFRALVEPRHLTQWFCDEADVQLREGGRYAFGGRRAYGGPAWTDGRVIRIQPDRHLEFSWPLAGAVTTVAYDLTADHERCVLTVRHEGVRALPIVAEWPEEHMKVIWDILLRQLEAYLAGRPVPSMSFPYVPPPVVRHEMVIAAPPDRVWEMLTVPAELNRWMAKDASVDLRVGGRYSYGWPEEETSYGPREILALQPPRVVAVSWRNEDGTHGTVTWTVEPHGSGTRLVLVHEALPKKPGILGDYHIGWWEFLTGLKFLAEGAAV